MAPHGPVPFVAHGSRSPEQLIDTSNITLGPEFDYATEGEVCEAGVAAEVGQIATVPKAGTWDTLNDTTAEKYAA